MTKKIGEYIKMNGFVQDIRDFIINNFLFGDGGNLQDTTSFMQAGIIDSTGILELVNHLEEKHNIKIEDDELVPENLDSVLNVDQFLSRKLSCAE